MEMDGQDSAKCRKSKLRDKMVILEFVLNELNDKIVNSAHLLPLNQEQNVKEGGGGGGGGGLTVSCRLRF